MINRTCRRSYRRRYFYLINIFTIGFFIFIVYINPLSISKVNQHIDINNVNHYTTTIIKTLEIVQEKSNYTYENFIQWNRSLCSIQSDHRGPHQKVIAISIYGSTSKYTDNPMFSWNKTILPFLKPLANEVKLLLPSWIIRLYIDFAGSKKSQQNFLYTFSNIDVCDINNIPLFGSSILTYLPGKMWRFLPIFDPFVDYMLSRDLDSPMIQRETETLDMWTSNEQEQYFFHIARDHRQHGVPILGGLWGAAPIRARQYLFDIFVPMLVPSIASRYNGSGDQQFLADFIWEKVKNHSLSFDSYFCEIYGGRPFLSQRSIGDCFLGCIRPCCTGTTIIDPIIHNKTCPVACRPKDHQDWIDC